MSAERRREILQRLALDLLKVPMPPAIEVRADESGRMWQRPQAQVSHVVRICIRAPACDHPLIRRRGESWETFGKRETCSVVCRDLRRTALRLERARKAMAQDELELEAAQAEARRK